MKHMKRIVSLALAIMMVLTMTLGVSASSTTTETTYTITISNDKPGHTYQAYQIFSGDLSEGTLSNITWGTGVDDEKLLGALTANNNAPIGTAFAACEDAADVAKVLEGKTDNSDTNKVFMEAFASVVGANLGTAAGTASMAADATSYVISGLSAGYYLIKDSDGTLADAYDAHTDLILRLVEDVTVNPKSGVPTLTKKVKENSTDAWQDAADAAINEDVEFKLTGTMPSALDTYATYSYTFHDNLSDGLTLNADSIKVMIGETDVTDSFTKTTNNLTDGCDFELSCENVKGIQGVTVDQNTEIVVTYTAKLNENAVIAGVGNPNTAYLKFSNNPNGTGIGKTPEDKVVVFTYELVANKVNGSNSDAALAGAKFTLYKKGTGADNNTTWTIVGAEQGNGTTDTAFTFKGLDAGEYKLSETKTPQGYNTADDIIFKIVAAYDTTSDAPKLTGLEVQDEQGNVISQGDNATFTVNTTGDDADKQYGNITTKIQNMKGSTLPSTGGMGTTLFYVVGAILAVGAAVLLVAKRRMSRAK